MHWQMTRKTDTRCDSRDILEVVFSWRRRRQIKKCLPNLIKHHLLNYKYQPLISNFLVIFKICPFLWLAWPILRVFSCRNYWKMLIALNKILDVLSNCMQQLSNKCRLSSSWWINSNYSHFLWFVPLSPLFDHKVLLCSGGRN